MALELYAQRQQHQQRPGWPCAGGRAVDPTYVAIAEGTGGHLYMLGPSEAAQTGTLMAWNRKHKVTVFRAMGEMGEGGAALEFSFPVDPSIESLVLTVSLQCPESVSILAPPGVEASGERVDFRAGRALRVVRPTPGPWRFRLAGRGVFFVTAEAVSELSLDEARFVQPGGRPGHEGLFPMKTPPALGSQGLLELELSKAPPRGVGVRLVASDGRTLERLSVEPESQLLVRVPLRHPAFRILVEGVDEGGWPFQRMQAPLTTLASPAQ